MTPNPTPNEPIRIAFMCVQNAGRSQMSTAFAERERARRGLEERVEILTGGTHPADEVHEEVIEVPVLLALVNVAMYFQRRFDWSGRSSGAADAGGPEPFPEDD